MSRSTPALVVPASNSSPVDEGARMLDLARRQIDDSLAEADRSVEAMLATLGRVLVALGDLSRSDGGPPAPGSAADIVDGLNDDAAALIEAMQFYDRLSQRLGHLRDGLAVLTEVFASARDTAQADPWPELHDRIRAMFANEPDRRLFDAVMRPSVRSASVAPPAADSATGGLELF